MLDRPSDERPTAKHQRSTVIAVADYGAGNLRSVTNVLDRIGAQYQVVDDGRSLVGATKILLPGVGHFGQLCDALDKRDLRSTLVDALNNGVSYLGICLGMQVLFAQSEEAEGSQGLSIFNGSIRKFDSSERIPHMGWNTLESRAKSALLEATDSEQYAYFAHSYFCPVIDSTTFTTSYDSNFSSVIEHGNIFGLQFHPEKSGQIGIDIITKFVGL